MQNPTAVADRSVRSPQLLVRSALLAWSRRYLSFVPSASSPVAVALSGGPDSVALLWAARDVWPGSVLAFHINHGLQEVALHFSSLSETLCGELGIPFYEVSVNVPKGLGLSVEAEARRVRYRALADAAIAHGAGVVLLGHHADDQAETVVLALTRGSGLAGLSAMGATSQKNGMVFGRPFLEISGATLKNCVYNAKLRFVEDPSNSDQSYTRNLIRHSVMPVLAQNFSAIVQTLSRVAQHAAQAESLLLALAESDLSHLGNPPDLKLLQALSYSRQANVLRHWIKLCAELPPTSAQLDELLRQVNRCRTRGHRIAIKVSTGYVSRIGPRLDFTLGPNALSV